jgi:hypothetical protein
MPFSYNEPKNTLVEITLHVVTIEPKGFQIFVPIKNCWSNCNSFLMVDIIASSLDTIYPNNISPSSIGVPSIVALIDKRANKPTIK